MENIDIGDTITIDDVLLVGSRRTTIIGQPIIKGAQVLAQVEEITNLEYKLNVLTNYH